MTEDDTFGMLKRVPISELHMEYKAHFWDFYQDHEKFAAWLDSKGWNEEDFMKAGREYENGPLHILYSSSPKVTVDGKPVATRTN